LPRKFTAGCNFRCPFCHNASLVTHIDNSNQISEEEILDYLKKRKGIIEGVCITGGEPLLQPDLEDFIIKIKDLGLAVKLDTNGSYPEKLISLVEKGLLDYVAMDIKNSKEKYPLTAGVENLNIADIEKSVEFLLQNHIPYEFRTTLAKNLHTPQDIVSIATWISGAKKYFLQNFVDSGDILGEKMAPLSQNEMENLLKTAQNSGLQAFIR
jgi:pyruvate formate lyase activating enzyme